MNKRNSVRYDSDLLLGGPSKVSISWEKNSSIESHVMNYCAHGIRVSIPPVLTPDDLPQKNDTVRVFMPIERLWLTGMCVYAEAEPEGSISIGIYFHKPDEQNYLSTFLRNSLNRPGQKSSFVKHEWEERVAKLCGSEDPKLSKIGISEWKMLMHRKGQTPPLELEG